MKLFIYYSNTGNGDAIAEFLKQKGVETRKILPVRDLPESFLPKMMVGGFQALTGRGVDLAEFDTDISAWDDIIIGSPIWAGKLCAPVTEVLRRLDLSGKRVSFILYSGSGKAPGAVKKLRKNYPDALIRVLKEPKEKLQKGEVPENEEGPGTEETPEA